jgi:hypothetical protein
VADLTDFCPGCVQKFTHIELVDLVKFPQQRAGRMVLPGRITKAGFSRQNQIKGEMAVKWK